MSKIIRVGTRGSDLALAQANLVIDSLRQANPEHEFVREIIKTSGDRDQSQPIAKVGYGVFVSELESALTGGAIDIAVHSLKDMPAELGPAFRIAAVPYREDPRDVIVSRSGAGLMDLPEDATVGTGSARRKTLLLDKRPDLNVTPIRGNVPTRLEKLTAAGGPDAIVLAAAGLKRLGLENRISEYLKCWDFVAAVGQGALAVETRIDDEPTIAMSSSLEHRDTRVAVDAERAFLAAVEGGCSAPVSAHGRVRDGRISLDAFAGDPDGKRLVRGSREGAANAVIELARELADELLTNGAADLVSPATGGSE